MCEVINVPVICGVDTNIIIAAHINESTEGVFETFGSQLVPRARVINVV